ncbi:MAG: FAD-dependent oxidoreductase [Candidatus Magasanikbacteria bacterium]
MKDLILKQKVKEAPKTWSFIWSPVNQFEWEPGQFLVYHMDLKNSDGRGTERYFTIASAPSEGDVMLTTRFFDDGSSFKDQLFSMEEGQKIKASGPSGEFVLDDYSRSYVFIAGGVGITPYRSILVDLFESGRDVNIELFYGNGSQDFVYKNTLDNLEKRIKGLEINYITSPNKINEDHIREAEQKMDEPLFFVSGPASMVDSLGETIIDLGIEKNRIRHDHFPGYSWGW